MKQVALINIMGDISYENEAVALIETIFAKEDDTEFAGLIVWINSGGGSFCVAQNVYDSLRRSHIPIIAVVGELCASAAYYAALAADHIVAQPASLVGGLCSSLESGNYVGLHDKLGVCRTIHSNGQLKQMLSPYVRRSNEGENKAIQDILDDMDSQFLGLFRERRPHVPNENQCTDGRLISGMRAKQFGLVDSLGGLFEATQKMAALLGTDNIELVSIEPDGDHAALRVTDPARMVSTLLAALHL